MLGAYKLGFLILTDKKLIFIRDDEANNTDDSTEYDIGSVQKMERHGHLGIVKVTFLYAGKEVIYDRVNKTNAERLVDALCKKM